MNDNEYTEGMKRLKHLLDTPRPPSNAIMEELIILATALATYEREHFPIAAPTPEEAAEFRREQEE